MALKELMELKAHKALKELMARMEQQVLKALKEPQALKVLKELQELMAQQELKGRMVQQALKADPLRRWRRVGDHVAREHAKQDRITRMVADDRCAARDWLEVRASFRFGMFSSCSMSSL